MPAALAPDERPWPLLLAEVNDGRLCLAPARQGGTHLFWLDEAGSDAMVGMVAPVMDAMRGLRCILAGRAVLRCSAGFAIREDACRPGHWFVCTLAGLPDDFELAPHGRALLWHDPTDRLPDPAVARLEPEVESLLLARPPSAEATLRAALARTGLRKRPSKPPARPRKARTVPHDGR
jgi:hypothetical protein